MKNYIKEHKNAALDQRMKRKQDFIVGSPNSKFDPESLNTSKTEDKEEKKLN